jgi:hypothetical protein
MSDTMLTVDLGITTNAEISGPSLSPSIGKVVGLFCSGYSPAAAPALAPGYGMFINEPSTTVERVWGTRFPLANAAELGPLGGSPATVRTDAPPTMTGKGFPRDGALLSDRITATTFLFAGGAPFLVPPAQLPVFGGPSAVALVPAGGLGRFTLPPADGTLVREVSKPEVLLIENGTKRWVTTPVELGRLGGFPSVRIVPDGALANIPDGPTLPPPTPNECAAIKTSITGLKAEEARLSEMIAEIDDPSNPRVAAPLKTQRARVREQITNLNNRAAVLGCP